MLGERISTLGFTEIYNCLQGTLRISGDELLVTRQSTGWVESMSLFTKKVRFSYSPTEQGSRSLLCLGNSNSATYTWREEERVTEVERVQREEHGWSGCNYRTRSLRNYTIIRNP